MKPTTSTTTLLAAILAISCPLTTSHPLPQLSTTSSTSSSSTSATQQNGITSPSTGSNACTATTLIFARGTFELSNMGSIVGPSLASDLAKLLSSSSTNNQLTIQGVNYAADVAGIFAEITGGTGTAAMVAEARAVMQKCPDTKVVLSGYSQGAMVVHNAVKALKGDGVEMGRVAAAVTFGDPFKSVALEGVDKARFKTFCATGDPVCGLGGVSALTSMVSSGGDQSSSTLSHLGYGADAPAAAKFIQEQLSA
ncbi:cutinase [Diplodia corticola]|uniref:Cutinase n=1 Tax=Diplodia corticola TaxID=236234 RepID=A0A1J9RZ58_9PEZI|nr:cutinase [Diplodia corticola]OJD33084.1 cutinase [Diplodia corticola]